MFILAQDEKSAILSSLIIGFEVGGLGQSAGSDISSDFYLDIHLVGGKTFRQGYFKTEEVARVALDNILQGLHVEECHFPERIAMERSVSLWHETR